MERADTIGSVGSDGVEALSDVVGDIYDAALDRSLWPKAFARASRFVGVLSTSIVMFHARRTGRILLDDYVIESTASDRYFDEFIKSDPTLVPKLFIEPGDMVANSEIMPMEEIERSRVYREWAKPLGVVDCLNATLEQSVGCVACLTLLMRTRSDDETKQRAKLLVPHFRRAVLIGGIVDLHSDKIAAFATTFDGLSAGIFFVAADAQLRHANAAGHAMLADGGTLYVAGARLAVRDAGADRTLRDILARAAGGDADLGTRGVALSLSEGDGDRERLVAHVLPLGDGERRRSGDAFCATAIVFVQPASRPFVAPPVALARAFDLTVAETRVAVAIVDIGGVPAVADALGLAESTIKVHLKSIYRKTGATRQADLVKLVARFASPFGEGNGRG